MAKKKQNSKRTWNYIVIGIIVFFVILFSLVFYVIFPKHPPASYYVNLLDKIGAPEGFTQNDARSTLRNNAFDPIEARRTYIGSGTFESTRNEMIQRLHDAGLSNAVWTPQSGNRAAGIVADCKDVSVFVRIYQEGNDPIDITANQTNNSSAPNCPQW